MGPCVRGCGAPKASEEASVAWHCTHWIPTAPTPDGDDGMEACKGAGCSSKEAKEARKTEQKGKTLTEYQTPNFNDLDFELQTPNHRMSTGS